MALLAVASENTAIAAIFVPSTTYYPVSYTHLTLPTILRV